jgi:hypothetical protein
MALKMKKFQKTSIDFKNKNPQNMKKVFLSLAFFIGTVAVATAQSEKAAKTGMTLRSLQNRSTVVRTMAWDCAETSREILLNREWIVTNGLGGYASGSVSGAITRKYHGILIAGLPAPLGRMVMWSHVSEFLRFSGADVVSLGAEERAGGQLDLHGADYLNEFRLEDGLPVWIYKVRDLIIEKRILLTHLQNTVHVSYQITAGSKLPRLELRPAFHFRHHFGADAVAGEKQQFMGRHVRFPW